MQQNFTAYYTTTLLPQLDALEAERVKIKNNLLYLLVSSLVVGVVAIAIYKNIVVVPIVALLCAAVYLFGMAKKSVKYNQKYKAIVIKKAAQYYFNTIDYEPYSGLSQYEFEATKLYNKTIDRYRTEDLFMGKKEKTNFSFSEVKAEYKTESKNGTHWHNIFTGIIFVADFNKDFNSLTLVKKNAFSLWKSDTQIKLEDPLFEKQFDVYATDETEARYLLTPSFMEKLLSIKQQFDTDISISFYQKNMYLALPYSYNNFETNIWSTLNNPVKLEQEIGLIANIIEVIDILDLNTRIWSKD